MTTILATSGWAPAGEQAAAGLWYFVGLFGPAVFAALLMFLVARALFRSDRYRVVSAFNAGDRRAVRDAVAAAEKRTVGEIVPVVVERSDPHPGAEWLAALAFLIVGSSLLAAWLPWKHPALLLLEQIALGAVGFALARFLPDLKRSFVFEDRASAVAEEQAVQEFYAANLHRTVAATGVLLFVSLFERRVIVLADEGIASRVDTGFWRGVDEDVLEGIRRGSIREGLVAGVGRVGELLSGTHPWVEGDRNEIPDRVIVRRE